MGPPGLLTQRLEKEEMHGSIDAALEPFQALSGNPPGFPAHDEQVLGLRAFSPLLLNQKLESELQKRVLRHGCSQFLEDRGQGLKAAFVDSQSPTTQLSLTHFPCRLRASSNTSALHLSGLSLSNITAGSHFPSLRGSLPLEGIGPKSCIHLNKQ